MLPNDFEGMAQALLEKTYRIGGNLIQFGSGKDGGREATWTQPPDHPEYSRPANQNSDIPKEWVFQVKYHDLDQRGWSVARDAVIEDLEKELEKIFHKYKVPCHAYVMITNVPFTGAINVGTRDKVTAIAQKWKKHIPNIYVWDAADLSRMLDANESVRTAYIDTILTGDTLKAIYKEANFKGDRRKSAFKAYLKFVTEREGTARAEEAGDKADLPLAEVFIDLTLKTRDSKRERSIEWLKEENRLKDSSTSTLLPENLTQVRASFALFLADGPYILLLGGPGLGKSTLTQFLALYQAARTFPSNLALRLAGRLKLPDGMNAEDLDAYVRPRFPFRVELRRYARWMSEQQQNQRTSELARYIAEALINANTSSTLEMDDVFDLASQDPILLILDGLDEVPNPETRQQIIENLQTFLLRVDSEQGDIQVILSSRPKGYSGEFEGFEPITWELNELERSDFDEYCAQWLKNRIRDEDERSEAKERISRGMMSEEVQRLARSLLQATVILTIVQGKIEIPHQRHILYKKYVEVIFDREKNKSQIVSERGNELLRLHERVGYELHCKMEQTRIEALDRDTFRNYVLNVLENYSGTELGKKTLRDVADEIIDAATDRLCLLVGKGKDQTDVDFVVQQFREYFAAVYLFNHPNADPDKVFAMLVRRGAYWAYVLQFYVAQASPNQQLGWVKNIDDQDDNENSAEAIVEATRTRRSVLNILPEFSLQSNTSLERILKIIFSKKTRWTWLEQESPIEILQLRSNFNRKTLWKLFYNFSTEDKATLVVELWLLARLSSGHPEDLKNICDKIQNLLEQENTRQVAIFIALQHDLKVNLINSAISEVETAFEEYRYKEIRKQTYNGKHQLSNIFSYQTKEKQCELILSRLGSWVDKDFFIMSKSAWKIIFPEVGLSFFDREISLLIIPYLCRNSKSLQALKSLSDKLGKIEGVYAEYLRHIVQAIQEPTNSALDNKARTIEKQIQEKISLKWRTENVLGPPVSAFSSVEEWEEFKRELRRVSSDQAKWIAKNGDFHKTESLWTALFFHPDHWPLLVAEGLITEQEYKYLLSTPLVNILKVPVTPLNIFEGISRRTAGTPAIPFSKIIRVALNIVEKEGIERITKARGLEGFLWRRRIHSVTIEEAENLLCQANMLPPLPSIWAGAILRLCLDIPELNLDILLEFWDKNEIGKPRFIYFPEDKLSDKHNQLLEKLLSSSRASALRLGIAIVAYGRPNKKIQTRLRDRLLSESFSYLNSDDTPYAFYQTLFNLDPSLEEFSLWLEPEVLYRMCNKPWMLDQLRRRFSSATDPKYQLSHEQLRQHLSSFIIQRSDYPQTVVLGALEAILKIDETNLSPLHNTMWQQCLEEDNRF
ncbi:hypothetical protein H6G81_06255 [Scytonema hofmannii FACHB-248]|uniref:NACHT domain-containing protein n=2 Tax=Nostocales TaxID=1161 RepID=A0ABR8GL74_9CYAN|nr:hypothetical protein [Scytonema hofmannii]MBD2604137.1 hypothetical protein [Scytonema hofmannii FACHB-248]